LSLHDPARELAGFTASNYRKRTGTSLRTAAADPALRNLEALAPELLETITGLAGAISASDDETGAVLKEMIRHDDASESVPDSLIDASTLKRSGLAPILARLSPYEALGLCSDVVLAEGQTHLPLLNFSLAPSPKNIALIQDAARALRALMLPHALVLESRRSYHPYRLTLLSQANWVNFLAHPLLLAPMVDIRYVAHRLLSGDAVFRINATSAKPMEPGAVAAF
jgi:hypothetical protein